jgi:hypothetical protein
VFFIANRGEGGNTYNQKNIKDEPGFEKKGTRTRRAERTPSENKMTNKTGLQTEDDNKGRKRKARPTRQEGEKQRKQNKDHPQPTISYPQGGQRRNQKNNDSSNRANMVANKAREPRRTK